MTTLTRHPPFLAACLLVLAAGAGCGTDASGVAGILVVSDVEVTPSTATVVVGATLQLEAVPKTASGIPVPGRSIAWTAVGGAVEVSPSGVVTAQAVGGPVRVRATIDGVVGEALVTVSDRPVASVSVAPSPVTVPVGQTLQLSAVAFDGGGTPLPGRYITWESSDPATVAVTTTGMVLGIAPGGPVTITATSEGKSAAAAVTAVAAPAVRLVFTTQPGNGVAGQPLLPAPQVIIQNQAGGTVTGATDPVTLSLASNPGGGTLGGTVTVNAVAGVASFPNLRVDRAGSGYRLEATATGLASAVSGAFSITPAVPSRLAFAPAPPTVAQSGIPFAPVPAIQLLDRDDAPVRQAGLLVTVALLSGGGTLSGALEATTDGNGLATFGALTLTGAPGNRVLQFRAGALQLNSGAIALGAGPPATLVITSQPSATAASGQAFTQQPVLQLRDASGNAVALPGVEVTVTIASGGGTLGGSATVATSAAGTAAFSGLSITGTVGSRTLGFQAPGFAAVSSSPIVLGPGAATQLTLATPPPASAANDAVFTPQPAVQLRDGAGNPVSAAGVMVTASIVTGGGVLGGTTTALTTGSGLASFSNLKITGTAGPRTLGFTAPGLGAVNSAPVTLTAGAATQLSITTQPSAVAASGQPFAQQPVLQLRDASGNAVTQAGVNVTAAIASGGGTLGGTAITATNATGAAVFVGLAISGTPGSRTLGFQAAGLAPATSSAIEISVTAASVTQVTLTTQPSASVVDGAAFPVQPAVQLRDALGNPVGVAGVVVTAAIATGGGVLGGTVTAATNAGGVATFTNLKITGLVGTRTLSFSALALPAVLSAPVAVILGPASQLTITTQPPASVANGATFSPQPAVQLRDAGGNPVGTAGVVVTAALATGAGTLGGTLTASTGAGGVATFSTLKITGAVGERTLGFSAAGLTAATSTTVNVTPGAARRLAITTQPTTAASGQLLAPQPVIQLVDTSGNAVSQAGVSVTAAIASGGGTLGGTATVATNASGAAVFTGLSIAGLVGSRTLGFSATGLTGATSAAIALTAGPAKRLAITTQPSTSAANDAAFAVQPAVQVQDSVGNPVAGAGVVVTAAIATGAGVLGGSATASTNAAGLATFAGLKITGLIGARTLGFSATGLSAATSTTVTITAGIATQLAITTQPSATVKVNTQFPRQPVIQLRDISGNAVSRSGVAVVVTVATGPGVLSGTTTANTNNSGTASFSKLALGTVGSYTLRFASGTLTPIVSAGIVVTP